VKNLVESGWHSLGPWAEIPDGKPVRRMIGEVPVLVYRTGQDVRVLADKCSHLSGPLSEGEVADGCVTCPWHGSVFRLADGAPVHGPATAPAPTFEPRVRSGELEARVPASG
jgi:nitrite reductase/ring-hydroxylating ferredoxin subunit